MLNEELIQFNDLFEGIGKSLDISETRYKSIVSSYESVGNWLAGEGSVLAKYKPTILAQGSFMLGTMIKPVGEGTELDIDLVCRLNGKNPEWTQQDLKMKIGQRLKEYALNKSMKQPENGRRCWTLNYADDSKFHMDILPCIVGKDYQIVLESSFDFSKAENLNDLAIRITDKEKVNYPIATQPEEWPKSNPFGYGKWFFQRAETPNSQIRYFSEAVQPIPKFRMEKLPLQRVVQILKRHRDIMYSDDEHRPISIIITTLAAQAYGYETNILQALQNIISRMPGLIKTKYSYEHNKEIKWIGNPVNIEENFADKWAEEPIKEKKFKQWLDKVRTDLDNIVVKRGLHDIEESMRIPFGEDLVKNTFTEYGSVLLEQRNNGTLKMAKGVGTLSGLGTVPIPFHKPYGQDE